MSTFPMAAHEQNAGRRPATLMPLARFTAGLLAALVTGSIVYAAPVVPTPGSVAGYTFSPPATSGGGSGGSTGPVETLSTCRVTPALSNRTLSMASRNWNGHTKPINVYYKMVGGGGGGVAGDVSQARFGSAGGSSAILKNGTLVAVAPGQSAAASVAGSAPSIVSGMFTVTSSDTLVFVNGGGAGTAGIGGTSFGGPGWYYDGYPGGGGAGYYGGGTGDAYSGYGAPAAGAAYATGGTGVAGGTGAVNGSLSVGGTLGAGGGNGAGDGATWGVALYLGSSTITAGGGGGQGRSGRAGGLGYAGMTWCPAAPTGAQTYAPTSTTFDLHPSAGQPGGVNFNGTDPSGYAYACKTGGGFGQIVLQYQAITCDVIPQYDQP